MERMRFRPGFGWTVLILASLIALLVGSCVLLRRKSAAIEASKVERIERHRVALQSPHDAYDMVRYPRPPLFEPALPGNADEDLFAWFRAGGPGEPEDYIRPLTARLRDPELAPEFLESLARLGTALSKPFLDPVVGGDPKRFGGWPQALYKLEYAALWFQSRQRHREALEAGLMLLALTHLHERFNCQRHENFVHTVLSRQRAFRLLIRLFENQSTSPDLWTWAAGALDRVNAGRLPSERAWEKHVYFTRGKIFNQFPDETFRTAENEQALLLETLDRVMEGRARLAAMPPGPEKWRDMGQLLSSMRGVDSWMLIVDWDEVLKEIWEVEQAESLARVAFALARHFAVLGRYPESLRDLSPQFLPWVPADPLHGTPYHYETRLRNAVVWTEGFNGAMQWNLSVP